MHEDAAFDISYRGYPVAQVSDGVTGLLSGDKTEQTEILITMLRSATISAKPPPGWNWEAELAGERVSIDREHFARSEGEQTAWVIHLASEH